MIYTNITMNDPSSSIIYTSTYFYHLRYINTVHLSWPVLSVASISTYANTGHLSWSVLSAASTITYANTGHLSWSVLSVASTITYANTGHLASFVFRLWAITCTNMRQYVMVTIFLHSILKQQNTTKSWLYSASNCHWPYQPS